MTTLLVTGSRGWSAVDVVRTALRKAVDEWGVTHLVHGNARGADRIAANTARNELGIAVKCFNADWEKHGKAGGVLRNQLMLDETNPDICLAFSALPITRGTSDMMRRAIRAGVSTMLVQPDGTESQADICERGTHGIQPHYQGFCLECIRHGERQIERGEYYTMDEMRERLEAK